MVPLSSMTKTHRTVAVEAAPGRSGAAAPGLRWCPYDFLSSTVPADGDGSAAHALSITIPRDRPPPSPLKLTSPLWEVRNGHRVEVWRSGGVEAPDRPLAS